MSESFVAVASLVAALFYATSNAAHAQPACVQGASSCVPGAPQKVSVCNAAGSWTTGDCPAWTLCTNDRCVPVCDGLPSSTEGSVICLVPNADGKNNGLLFVTNDVARLGESGKQSTIVSGVGTASVVASGGQQWPYAWFGLSPIALIGFKLATFPSSIHKISIWVRNRRSGSTSQSTRQFFFAKRSSTEAPFSTGFVSPPGLTWANATTWIDSNPPAPTTAQFNYSSNTFNFVGWSTAGDGDGNVGDAMLVNWMLLAIKP